MLGAEDKVGIDQIFIHPASVKVAESAGVRSPKRPLLLNSITLSSTLPGKSAHSDKQPSPQCRTTAKGQSFPSSCGLFLLDTVTAPLILLSNLDFFFSSFTAVDHKGIP